MALAKAPTLHSGLLGRSEPRIAPPFPARSDIDEFRRIATDIGIDLIPWQDYAARFLTARGPDGPLYREVCIVVARQNGKTWLMKPLIIKALQEGKRVLHIAQTRELPRQMFALIASSLPEELFLRRRGKGGKMQVVWPRGGSGQEEILLANGGSYRIAAATSGGARGQTADLVIIDELREMESMEVIASVESTTITSDNAQLVYLSNAGTDLSIVLNSVRDRAGKDDNLAYLEWSASPERSADDREGWAESNPALGYVPSTIKALEALYQRHSLGGTIAIFETENLCRWVTTMRQRLVDEHAWMLCHRDRLEQPRRVHMGISVDPSGTRAAAAIAWQDDQRQVNVRLTHDVKLDSTHLPTFGDDLKRDAARMGVASVSFDPLTDAALAKFFKVTHPLSGQKWANASSLFANLVQGGRLLWTDADAVTDDLVWTARKDHDESGSFQAVRANDDRPIPAALAAIRAVSAAFGPKLARPRIY